MDLRKEIRTPIVLLVVALALVPACVRKSAVPGVFVARDATWHERAAAAEVRRYLYLTTGELPDLREARSLSRVPAGAVAVLEKNGPFARGWSDAAAAAKLAALGPEDYWLKSVPAGSGRVILVAGGSGPAVLYGAYQLAEKLGVRFSLEGDVVPDGKIAPPAFDLDETGRPLFAVRGIQPFHDFPEGPDWWTLENYKAVLSQLPKLRMNFFGLHTYPENPSREKGATPNAEPTVWIGRERDFGAGREDHGRLSGELSEHRPGQLGLRVEEDRRLPFRREPALRAGRLRERRHGRLQPRPGRPRGRERGLRQGRRRLQGRFHAGPAPRRQDLRRDGDAPDGARARPGAPDRLRPRPQRPGRRQGPLQGDVRTHRRGLSRRLLLVLDVGGLDLGRRQAGSDRGRDHGPRHGRPGLEGSRPAVQAGHLRLGPRSAVEPHAFRPGPAQGRGHEHHQPRGRARRRSTRASPASRAGPSGPSPGWRTTPR